MLVLRQVGTVNYKKATIPEDYKCDDCGAHKVRLWREYQSEASRTKLLCASCAEKNQKECNKKDWESPFSKGQGDQIGWYVPAVPTEGRNTYWGYTTVPEAGVIWWRNLPIR